MSRQNQTREHNTFVGGLITEASPLTYPDNSAIELANFELYKTGEIKRRLGMDFEGGYSTLSTPASLTLENTPSFSVFNWDNPNGYANQRILVVHVNKTLRFFDANAATISSTQLFSVDLDIEQGDTVDGATVDGFFVLSTGKADILIFEYDGSAITQTSTRLKVRDLFGVQYVKDGIDYRSPENIDLRVPSNNGNIESKHEYNLRNGSWAIKRYVGNDEVLTDPILAFYEATKDGGSVPIVDYRDFEGDAADIPLYYDDGGLLPSYSDNLAQAVYPDAADEDDRNADRFFVKKLVAGSSAAKYEAPMGRFVIDLLDRGASRAAELTKINRVSGFTSSFKASDLPQDRSVKGASCVAEFAGRVFYSGFSSETIQPDRHSPRLGSYVLFSKLVKSVSDINRCFQDADPTSKDDADLVPTDGGFIRLDGASQIRRLVNIGDSLLILADNGVWAIMGGSDYGFTATENKVVKVSDKGCVGARSVVVVDNSVIYWGYDAIYAVGRNQYGGLEANNISDKAIKSFYDSIDDVNKNLCQGYFDSYERKVHWVYGNDIRGDARNKELIFDVSLGSFYPHLFCESDAGLPIVVAPFEVPPYKASIEVNRVVVGSNRVVVGADVVSVTSRVVFTGSRELSYLASWVDGDNLNFSFARYKDQDFIDWVSFDGVGCDAEAYLITGFDGGGDYQRNKQVPYITFHFRRTEEGLVEDEFGDFHPAKQSSCKVQARWDFSDSAASNRWGKEFQAYRYRRFYMPANSGDAFDTGFSVISTKNRLRGKGKVLSLKISTEAGKDCQLLGWSMLMGIGSNV